MANLLHVINEPQKVVKQSKRVLKENGKIIIIDFTPEGMSFFDKMQLMYRYFKTYKKLPSKKTSLTMQKAKEILEKENFKIEQVELIGDKMKAIFIVAKK